MPSDFPGAFTALRAILQKHAKGLLIQADTPTDYTVISPAIGPNKKPMWFAAVLSRKSAVSYHLMPLYFNPKLQAQVTPELLARKQGKTCFNFQRPDPVLFKMLDELTRVGREQWERAGFLKPSPVTAQMLEAALKSVGGDPAALARTRKAKGKQAAAKRAATIKAGKAASQRGA